MRIGKAFVISVAALAVSVFHAEGAKAANGTCTLNTNKASGTYGYAVQGVATGTNLFVPFGPLAQAGTVTLAARREDSSTLVGV